MAAKINWHRYGTKLRHCNPMYIISPEKKEKACHLHNGVTELHKIGTLTQNVFLKCATLMKF